MKRTLLSLACLGLFLTACDGANDGTNNNKAFTHTSETTLNNEPAQESASDFVARIEAEGLELGKEIEAAYWVRNTHITPDTAVLAAKAGERSLEFESRILNQAKKYKATEMDAETARAIELILRGSSAPAPNDPELRAELATILTQMSGLYGSGKYCKSDGECRTLDELKHVLVNSKDPVELLDVWQGWRTISPPFKERYQRFVELANQGARDSGFDDLAHAWKSKYDMGADEFTHEAARLWGQVKPFYEELHCHVRAKLNEQYGDEVVPLNSAIPAHLLGNMWAQTWDNIYPLIEPYKGVDNLDVSKALKEQGYDEVKMTQTAEAFFTSLGLPALPDSFYTNSLLKKPKDREVVCHASAWDMDNGNDPRIKQCIKINEDQLGTLHHELGHIYYYLMYKDLRPTFKGGAHDGFHEAIGDTIQLSMTPSYLKEKGLIDTITNSPEATINAQMKMALERIAFLPFGKLIDEWRWKVFSGETSPDDYNKSWWSLREQYQGIKAPVQRSESDFDPGAKYHIPGNTPYTRYFLSFIMQFQFHKALCDTAGHEGPLHECSIYNNKKAGKALGDMLVLGQSKPWPDAMQALTGQREMDASAIIDYFKPLNSWLKEQNQDRQCGW